MTKDKKTYKRELAVILLAGLGYVVYTGDVEMVKVIVWPIFAFVFGAFGMDSYAKQIKTRDGSYTTDGDTRL